MNKFQKILLMTCTLVNGATLAGTMGPACVKEGVTVPCERRAWEIGGQALYLNVTNTNMGNALASFTNSNNETEFFNPFTHWQWGFMLEGAFHFNKGSDLNLNWYHYNNLQSPTFLQNTPTVSPVSINSALNTQWNAVNGEYGQLIDFTDYSNLRLFGGGQYFQLIHNITYNVSSLSSSESLNTRYNGFGPRIGADLAHHWANGFALYATGAASLLIGDADFNTTTVGFADAVVGTSHASILSLVPELEGKLGAKYLYALSQGDLSLNLGYMWVNYFNAYNYITVGRSLDTTSDFGVNGPYIGMKWLGTL